MQKVSSQLMVALDVDLAEEAYAITSGLDQVVEWVKVGKQLFVSQGPEVVRVLKEEFGKKVFLDLKFHDIPNTVGQAVRRAAAMGADLTNVHAAGGFSMLRAASEAAAETGIMVVAVTVLTSLDQPELAATGVVGEPAEQVLRLAALTARAGLPGVVCSACEIALLRREMGDDFCLVVPGIRPGGTALGDQKRVMTPGQAVQAGADYLVVGRPITAAASPAAAALAILREMALAEDASCEELH